MRKAAYPFVLLVENTNPGSSRGKDTPPMLRIIEEADKGKEDGWGLSLDDLAREGARRMLEDALQVEVAGRT